MMIAMIIGFASCFFFTNTFIHDFGANGTSYIQILCFVIVFIELIVITEVTIWKKKKAAHTGVEE